MADSLLEELPKIVNKGKKEAQKILDGLSKSNKVTLQTNELVLPSKDNTGLFRGHIKENNGKSFFNKIIYGDNLLAMQALLVGDDETQSLRNKINVIYIDPPYDSKADYRTKIKLPNVDIDQKPTVIEQFAYSDTWKDGTASYLQMMVPRLILMRELLSDNGTIYIHIDWHVGHYLKVVMDEIFGKDNFRNFVIWRREVARGMKSHSKFFGHNADYLLIFSKGSKPYYKQVFELEEIKNLSEYKKDEYGYFSTSHKGTYTDKSLIELNKENRLFVTNNGKLIIDEKNQTIKSSKGTIRIKYYLSEKDGKYFKPRVVDDIWDDIPGMAKLSSERLDYATQKPEKLLKRIIEASCPPNGIVADFFSGSGTVGAVADKLGRKWIMNDLGKPACMITRKRMIDLDSNPFLFQSIGDYQKEQYEKSEFRTIRDLAHVVIHLYGAVPFPNKEGPSNAGYIKQSRTLVVVDSPSKMTGYNTLRRAQEFRNSFAGGWKKVVVLGWNFVSDIGQIISSFNDENLEVLVIPPDLLDMLKSKAKYRKLIDSGRIKFSSLQYLTVKPVRKADYDKNNHKLIVELDNYVLLSPDALPLDDKNKAKLEKVISEDPLSLIEYWSIDPDYDGEVFRSKWQDYRQNVANDDDPFRVVRKAELIVPKEKRKRKICVKAVDVFGFESVSEIEVE